MINLSYLRYFYICAQCGSFTKAAAKLGISQPSLSMQIKSFEEQLGFRLFLRAGRSIQLSSRGQGLFLYAAKVFEVTDEMETYLKKNEPSQGISLKIGVSDEVERPFVADVVGRLIKSNSIKGLVPTIVSKKHDEVVALVCAEEMDLVITNNMSAELKLVCSIGIPVMLISANSIQQSKVQRLSLQNLLRMLEQKLILPTNEMILAKEIKKFVVDNGLSIETVLSSNITACITRAVQEKLGASFLPTAYVQRELKSGQLNAYGPREGFWQHRLYLYTYKGNSNSFILSLSKILQDFSAINFDSQVFEI